MFGQAEEQEPMSESDIARYAKLGENMLADLERMRKNGTLTPEQQATYTELIAIYNAA